MADPTQIGELKLLGLQDYKYIKYSDGSWAADGQSYTTGSNVYTGMVVQSATVTPTAEEEEHLDEDGETKTIIIENPGIEVSLEVVMKDAATDPESSDAVPGSRALPPPVGALITISDTSGFSTTASFRVTSAPVTLGRGKEAVKMSFTAKREASMAAIYDA